MARKLPRIYLELKEREGKFIDAVEALGRAAKSAGPLDERTAQLIQLAAAAGIRSEGSVHSHVRRALDAGATPEQIRHALILLTSTIGFPTVAAALTWADDVLKTSANRRDRRGGRRGS
jgi:AhpD family alkylhydroperoxidase